MANFSFKADQFKQFGSYAQFLKHYLEILHLGPKISINCFDEYSCGYYCSCDKQFESLQLKLNFWVGCIFKMPTFICFTIDEDENEPYFSILRKDNSFTEDLEEGFLYISDEGAQSEILSGKTIPEKQKTLEMFVNNCINESAAALERQM